MYDAVDIRVFLEDSVEIGFACDVEFNIFRSLSANQFYTIEDLLGGVVEVVDDDYFVAGFKEGEGGERADIACATVGRLADIIIRRRGAHPVIKQDPADIVFEIMLVAATSGVTIADGSVA